MTTPTTEPDDPQERIIVRLDRLIDGVEAGTSAVAAETAARKQGLAEAHRRSTMIAAALLLLVISVSYTGYRWVKSNEITCTERVSRTVQLREALAAEFELTAEFYEVAAPERAQLIDRIQADLLDRYPDPDC